MCAHNISVSILEIMFCGCSLMTPQHVRLGGKMLTGVGCAASPPQKEVM